jgi:hypothetical protein
MPRITLGLLTALLLPVLRLTAQDRRPAHQGFEPIREARVDTVNGVPRLTINGRPVAPFAFFYNSDMPDWRESGFLEKQVVLARETGVHIYSMSFRTPRRQPEGAETDWDLCDGYMQAFIDLDPNAVFLLRIYPGPNWSWDTWKDIAPEHLALYADGSRGPISIASPHFWDPTDQDLARIIRHYEAGPFAGRILAYEVGGPNIEMFHTHYRTRGPDYNPLNHARFREWLRATYASDAGLQDAWGDPGVTLTTARIPEFEPGRFPMHGKPPEELIRVFYEIPGEQDWVDFSRYSSEIVADRLVDWARLIKRETGGRKLSLFFYGYTFELPGSMSGHYALQRALACEDVDLLGSPYSYVDRDVGRPGSFMCPIDSMPLHGKLWFNEDDTRTSAVSARVDSSKLSFHGTGGATTEESAGVLSRNLGSLLVHRAGCWWMDLVSAGAFDRPEFWQVWKERLPLYRALYQRPEPYRPEVAVLVDEVSKLYVGDDWDTNYHLLYRMRESTQCSGASVGFYTLQDFVDERVPTCRAYVFANAFRLEDAQIEAVRARLQREGATAIWAYAPAYLGPGGADVGRSARLMGMQVRVDEGALGSKGIAPMPSAWGREMRVTPRLNVTDSRAQVLGRYRDGGAVSAARVQDGSVASVFVGDMGVTPELMRALFREAEVHVWADTGEAVQTDGRILVVHARDERDIVLHPPPGTRLEPLSAVKTETLGSDLVVPFRRGQTRWFTVRSQPGE